MTEVRALPGGGAGLFATAAYAEGDEILAESPLAVLSQTYAAPAYDVGAALARAAANIRRDDVVVGTFDRLETFLKVAVLEIGGVRPERVCVGHVHGGARDRTARMMRAWPAAAHARLLRIRCG